MANALPILLLGGAAVLMMSGKKKKGRGWDYEAAPPAPSEGVAFNEQNFVNVVFEGKPENYWLGEEAVRKNVSGVRHDGFVHPLSDETLVNWYTRVAYWGAYPYPAPYEIPPQCMMPELAKKMGVECDPGFIPYRDAVLRIYGLVMAEGKKRGLNMDARMGSNS